MGNCNYMVYRKGRRDTNILFPNEKRAKEYMERELAQYDWKKPDWMSQHQWDIMMEKYRQREIVRVRVRKMHKTRWSEENEN